MEAKEVDSRMIMRARNVLCLVMALMMAVSVCLAEETPSLKDDFYAVVNAEWLEQTEIPSDAPEVSVFSELGDQVQEVLKADFQAMLDGEKAVPEELTDFIELYRLAADYETRNALGAEPLKPYLERIEALDGMDALRENLADLMMAGMPLPFGVTVMADMADASVNALYMGPCALFLSVKDYYLDDATRTTLQGVYGQMSKNLLVMAGKTEEEAAEIVSQALAFDESLAAYSRTAEERSDATVSYNPQPLAQLDEQVENFDLTALLGDLMKEVPETVIVTDPAYFEALDELVSDETFPQMKSWMLVAMVNAVAPYLSDDFRVQAAAFSLALSGAAEPTGAEEAAYNVAMGVFSEVVGIYYGKTYFGEEARQDVQAMVEQIVDVYRQRLTENEWLSDETREMAIRKLDHMSIHVGYPDEARPMYALLKTVPASEGGTLVDNMMAYTRASAEYVLGLCGQPVDRSEWPLSANTVNAMYTLTNNSINFPAAILQEPFYSLEQSASANYGAIGAVIAHEISHAFDPNGSKFDENGSLANWWTKEDLVKFEELSQAMIEEFDVLPFAGGTVNGTLTVTENVADAGGLSCALEALKQTEDEPDLEAFFTSWARAWRNKATEAYMNLNLTMDEFKAAIIAQMQAGKVVWFGSDVGHFGERTLGVWDDRSFDFAALTGLSLAMDKADALDYGLAAMNHAMVLTGVNLDEAGKPTRWKIENSWGDKNGEKGYYVCSDSWFDQYVFQAAVEREYLGGLADLAAQEPIVLEPWDPMGTLAD